jgi:hypothetical protein
VASICHYIWKHLTQVFSSRQAVGSMKQGFQTVSNSISPAQSRQWQCAEDRLHILVPLLTFTALFTWVLSREWGIPMPRHSFKWPARKNAPMFSSVRALFPVCSLRRGDPLPSNVKTVKEQTFHKPSNLY